MWQLGAVHVKDDVLAAAELIIGNLSDDGYLLASDEELLEQGAGWLSAMESGAALERTGRRRSSGGGGRKRVPNKPSRRPSRAVPQRAVWPDALHEALDLVRQMDPVGVAARDLRECLMAQLKDLTRVHDERGGEPDMPELLEDAMVIADKYLHMLQNKQIREIGRAMSKSMERVERCVALIRTLDPKPGLRYNVPRDAAD